MNVINLLSNILTFHQEIFAIIKESERREVRFYFKQTLSIELLNWIELSKGSYTAEVMSLGQQIAFSNLRSNKDLVKFQTYLLQIGLTAFDSYNGYRPL